MKINTYGVLRNAVRRADHERKVAELKRLRFDPFGFSNYRTTPPSLMDLVDKSGH